MRSRTKTIAIVGAGPGGLTAAMILARRGYRVRVFEKDPIVGGRNQALRAGPFTFDTGPTFLMVPQVLEEVFELAGTTTAGSRFPERPCGASQRERGSQAAHDVP